MEENESAVTNELSRFTKVEFFALLRRIASDLPDLTEGSLELHNAQNNLQNIRRALASAEFRPR